MIPHCRISWYLLLCCSGAIVAPKIFDSWGRKITMYTASWVFVIGATLQAAAINMLMLQVTRLLSGAGIGALSMCSPVYM
jgi:MFS transporter, SP family, xylose:H+ symportor